MNFNSITPSSSSSSPPYVEEEFHLDDSSTGHTISSVAQTAIRSSSSYKSSPARQSPEDSLQKQNAELFSNLYLLLMEEKEISNEPFKIQMTIQFATVLLSSNCISKGNRADSVKKAHHLLRPLYLRLDTIADMESKGSILCLLAIAHICHNTPRKKGLFSSFRLDTTLPYLLKIIDPSLELACPDDLFANIIIYITHLTVIDYTQSNNHNRATLLSFAFDKLKLGLDLSLPIHLKTKLLYELLRIGQLLNQNLRLSIEELKTSELWQKIQLHEVDEVWSLLAQMWIKNLSEPDATLAARVFLDFLEHHIINPITKALAVKKIEEILQAKQVLL